MGVIRRKHSSVQNLPDTALLFAVAAACLFASAASLPAHLSTPNESQENNKISAATLSDLVARKARAVDATRHALVLVREVRSLNDSIAGANRRIRDASHAREKLKVTSARLEEQRKVIDELSAILDDPVSETAERLTHRMMYWRRAPVSDSDSGSGWKPDGGDSLGVRLALVTAGAAKREAERLVVKIARKVMRLRDKIASYSIAVTFRDQLAKALEQRLPLAAEAEEKARKAVQEYSTAWRHAMESFPERDVLRIVEEPSLKWEEGGTTTEGLGLGSQGKGTPSPIRCRDAGIRIAAADAEEAVARALLDSLQLDIKVWKAQARERQEVEYAESDLEYAEFQVKGAEKDLVQAKDQAAKTVWLTAEQKKILEDSVKGLAEAMAVESRGDTQRAWMQREEAELVKAQAERVWEEMGRWMEQAEALVLERTQAWRDALAEREKAAMKVAELDKRHGRVKQAAEEAERLMKLLKPIVNKKHDAARASEVAREKLLTLGVTQFFH
ncbi:hypothetical protein CLOM_g7176 [Closterium sp. NIES-68]|nr:hypothetical protein CLOM_g7176 [Closterium sp. NIES-68]GJP78981.1 hypothetical protein CLOP_g9238 [Closterium sp. NIES-67]